MTIFDYAIEFHINASRQSPGSDEATLAALHSVQNFVEKKSILDIGCGTGAQTLTLALNTKANITPIDILQPFLDMLSQRAESAGFSDRVHPVNMSMDALDFPTHSFDLIWTEGSVYHAGFSKMLNYWKQFLTNDGHLVVSDLCQLADKRPNEISAYWAEGYPDMTTIPQRIKDAKNCDYTVINHFTIPPECWTDGYYEPIRKRSPAFAEKYKGNEEVRQMLNMGIAEADMYDKYGEYYGYVFFIMNPCE